MMIKNGFIVARRLDTTIYCNNKKELAEELGCNYSYIFYLMNKEDNILNYRDRSVRKIEIYEKGELVRTLWNENFRINGVECYDK